MLWDLNEGKHLYTLDGGGETINALCFSPNRYWLCAATGPSIKIWVGPSAVFFVTAVVEDRSDFRSLSLLCIFITWFNVASFSASTLLVESSDWYKPSPR